MIDAVVVQAVVGEEDGLARDVAMDYVAVVRRLKGGEEVTGDARRLGLLRAPPLSRRASRYGAASRHADAPAAS